MDTRAHGRPRCLLMENAGQQAAREHPRPPRQSNSGGEVEKARGSHDFATAPPLATARTLWHHARSMERLTVLEFIRHKDPTWTLPRHFVRDLELRFPEVAFLAPAD